MKESLVDKELLCTYVGKGVCVYMGSGDGIDGADKFQHYNDKS